MVNKSIVKRLLVGYIRQETTSPGIRNKDRSLLTDSHLCPDIYQIVIPWLKHADPGSLLMKGPKN